jgi:hypothetical protein
MGSTAVARQETAYRQQNPGWAMICSLVLDGITSPHTHRAYAQALDEFLIWFQAETGRPFSKATVQRYRRELEIKGLAASSINVRLTAIRRLAIEAADNGTDQHSGRELETALLEDLEGPHSAALRFASCGRLLAECRPSAASASFARRP